MEIAGFGGEQYGAADHGGDDFFPGFRADESDAGNVVGILVQKAQLFPPRLEVNAVHFGELGNNADGPFFALVDGELELRLEGLHLVFGDTAGDFQSEDPAAVFLQSLNQAECSRGRGKNGANV